MIRHGIENQLNAAAHGAIATVVDAAFEHYPLLWVSAGFLTATGYTTREAIGRSISSFYSHPERIRAAIRDGTSTHIDVTMHKRDGAVNGRLWLEPLLDDEGRPLFVLGVHEGDAAQRQHLLATLNEHREALHSASLLTGYVTDRVLQSIFAGVIAVNRKGDVLYANHAALAVLERTVPEAIGRSIAEVLGPLSLKLVLEGERAEEHLDHTVITAKGNRREAGLNVVRVNASHDAEVHCVFVFRDIGDRRQYEMELRRLKGLSALGQMAAGFAHEVRNPLAAMRSLNECLLLELAEPDSRREYATRMSGLISRIESLVEHSLRYARPRPPKRSSVDPSRVVYGALETLAPRVGSASHSAMPIIVSPDLPRVEVDEMQMVQVLVNLLENALDSTGDPRRVALELALTTLHGERFVLVQVTDDGPGIDDETMQRVFDPFYTTKPKGTGLGLAIAQRLMRDNGGHLLATSEPFVSTVFSLLMPLVHTEPAIASNRTS